MKGVKKTKSNEQLNALTTGSRASIAQPSPSLSSIAAQNNNHLSYTWLRLSLRFVQFVGLIFLMSFSGVVSRVILRDNGLLAANMSLIILCVLMTFSTAGLAFLYVLKWLSRPTKGHGLMSKLLSFDAVRVLIIETVADMVSSAILLIYFSVFLNSIGVGTSRGNQCPAGFSFDCDRFNWLMTWQFFTFAAYLCALIADLASWFKLGYKAYGSSTKYDDSTLMELRRLRMAKT
ncbi:hypothetical protein MP228_004337 [Amoeboaphelidium protococcarum]|nr:hypothetical protein MP228_004337 [Amoeboaphelidium protococcarum]